MLLTRTLRFLSTAIALTAAPAWTQTTSRASVDSSGSEANGSSTASAVSFDGRYVVFSSAATNLVPGDTNGRFDVFVRDRQLGTTTRVSVDSGGAQANSDSSAGGISADGSFVVFESSADNLVAGDTNAELDVFVHDLQTGATVRASVDSAGAEGNGQSFDGAISADGSRVAFQSIASNLVAGDTNALFDVFVRDLSAGTTVRASLDSAGLQSPSSSFAPRLSGNGSRVVFMTDAALVPTDADGGQDIYVRDLLAGTTVCASLGTGGTQSFGGFPNDQAISDDGQFVAFRSIATDLVPGDTNFSYDIFRHDLSTLTTIRVSVSSGGIQAIGGSDFPTLSSDGRYVAFRSAASNLVTDDTAAFDAFVRDVQEGVTTRVSLSSGGAQQVGGGAFSRPAISADGGVIAFTSDATNLVAGDANSAHDAFVRVRDDTWSFTRSCFPGEDGIVPCPCSNPPTESGRGCDNHGTGPAESGRLRGSGVPSLAADTVLLTADGLNNTSFSVFWQGRDPASATGVAHGAGVRCVTSTLKRLYNGNASGGLISRPGGSDPSVHARSAATGDTILAGQTRHYFVIYRDPSAAGPCGNASSTINLTNAGRITWAP